MESTDFDARKDMAIKGLYCMHECISPESDVGVGGRHETTNHLKVGAICSLGASELLRLIRHRSLWVDAAFITQLHDRVETVGTKVLAGAVVPEAFRTDAE